MSDAVHRWRRAVLPVLPPAASTARMALAGIVLVGAALRGWWAAVAATAPTELRDPVFYMVLADNLAAGDGYTFGSAPEQGVTAYYPPGYPLFVAGVLWLVRRLAADVGTFDVAVWTNVALSVATIPLVYLLGRRLRSVVTGIVAAGIWAVWPNLVFHSGVVLTETLFLFLFLLLLLVTLGDPSAVRAPGYRRLATIGLLFGALGLVRPISFIAAPAFLLLWWPAGRNRALRSAAVVGIVTALVVAPWTIRNIVTMDSPVLISTNFGDNLCIGHNPEANGGFGVLAPHCFDNPDAPRPEKEIERQSENIRLALRYVLDHPGTTLARTPEKGWITVRDDHDGLAAAADYGTAPPFDPGVMDALELVADAAFYLVLAAAAVGGVLVLRRRDPDGRIRFLLVACALQLLPPLATFGDARFKMPIYPALAILAAVTLTELRSPARRKPST